MTEPTTPDGEALAKGTSLWRDAWRRLLKNRAAMAGGIIVLLMGVMALSFDLLSRYVTRYTYDEQHLSYEPKPIGAHSVPMHYPTLADPAEVPLGMVDGNQDGFIDRAELSTYLSDQEFRRFDTSGDGFLDAEEVGDGAIPLLRNSPTDTLRIFDDNKDGKVSPAEARANEVTEILPDGEARWFIAQHDTDRDRKISASEYVGVPEPRMHLFGTDELGRDLLTRVLQGGRVSLMVGFIATFVSFLIGILWGATAGFLGGRTDNIMMRFVDVMYGLPFMFLVILLMVIFQEMPAQSKLYLLFLALGAVQWLTMSRIVRGQVISLKNREFVEAARCVGVSSKTIILRHLIPNALGPIIVYSTLTVPAVMLEEAFLSFLGLGVQAPYASWGSLAAEGAKAYREYPWLIIFPGAALAVTLLALNFLGDGLRDALDPQVRKD